MITRVRFKDGSEPALYECRGCPFKTNSWPAMVTHAKDIHGQDI